MGDSEETLREAVARRSTALAEGRKGSKKPSLYGRIAYRELGSAGDG